MQANNSMSANSEIISSISFIYASLHLVGCYNHSCVNVGLVFFLSLLACGSFIYVAHFIPTKIQCVSKKSKGEWEEIQTQTNAFTLTCIKYMHRMWWSQWLRSIHYWLYASKTSNPQSLDSCGLRFESQSMILTMGNSKLNTELNPFFSFSKKHTLVKHCVI